MNSPSWNNTGDREKYYELINKKSDDMTEEEHRFFVDMYHQEEGYYGLDGD